VTLAGLGTLATIGAASASASTTPGAKGTVTATTRFTDRPDSGGGGYWGYDSYRRVLEVQYLGKSTDPAHVKAPYMYTARITDTGTFVDEPGVLTPNQGKHPGLILKPKQVGGAMNGYGQWTLFYASNKDAKGYVPRSIPASQNSNPAYASSTWPSLAFPAGTTFAGLATGEISWGYTYSVPALTVTTTKVVNGKKVTHVKVYPAQNWADTAFNGYGQSPRAGDITGR
jgi:hypothetical protein